MMSDFLRIWQQENDWRKACRKYVADDIKIVEPTSLPQSGELYRLGCAGDGQLRDGKIVKMEVAHWDHAGLVATQF